MRTMFLFVLMVLMGTAARAAEMCPGGQVALVRTSRILPNGSIAGFREAARDHAAWYRAHGLAVTQFVAPVMVYSAKAKGPVASDREIMTVRLGSAEMPRASRDAAWATFVTKYRANATIVRETRTCFPKGI